MYRYFIIYKPYSVLSQFSPRHGKEVLSDYFHVPINVYPVGRLDEDSEGLLILTNDKKLTHRLLDPFFAHEREYLVQVDGAISYDAINEMVKGVVINISGSMYETKPCKIFSLDAEPEVGLRNPPVRMRNNIPTSWIRVMLTEGKNRQIRKMTAKVGFPTLRIIRYRIERIELGKLKPGEIIELSQKTIYKKLFHERSL